MDTKSKDNSRASKTPAEEAGTKANVCASLSSYLLTQCGIIHEVDKLAHRSERRTHPPFLRAPSFFITQNWGIFALRSWYIPRLG